jgi:hypothetical protein
MCFLYMVPGPSSDGDLHTSSSSLLNQLVYKAILYMVGV